MVENDFFNIKRMHVFFIIFKTQNKYKVLSLGKRVNIISMTNNGKEKHARDPTTQLNVL